MKNNVYGYVRVSTKEQNEARQVIAMHVSDDPNARKTGDGNTEKDKQPVSDDPNVRKTGDGNTEKDKQPVSDDPDAKKTGDGNTEKDKQPVTEDPNTKKAGDGNAEKDKQPVSDDPNAKKTGDGNAEKEKQPVTDDPNAKKTGDGNAEKDKQPVTDDPNAKKTGDGNAEKEKQPVTDDPNAKKTGEASPDIKNPPEDGDSASDKKSPPIENTANPSEEVNPRNLPVLSTRAPLREDLPEGATKEGNIGDYPVKFANWDPAFANPEDAMENKTLEPGTYYRYGGPDGNFITKREPGQPLENLYDGLALPYEYDPSKWSVVDVKEPLQNVHCGEVGKQSKFGENGGGWQAELPHAIWEYPSDKVSMRPLREEENW